MEQTIRLEPPGAGIPRCQLYLARTILFLAHHVMSTERATNMFARETKQLLIHAQTLHPRAAAHPVLIPPTFGLEDSSRNWSIFMTLQHLVIVNTAIVGMIEKLVEGQAINRTVRTQDVKPSLNCGEEIISQFRKSSEHYIERIHALPCVKSEGQHAHPWFGLFDAHRWHCLAAMHMGIHRRQIRKIESRLTIFETNLPS